MITSVTEPELFRVTGKQPMPVAVSPGRTAILSVTYNPTIAGKSKERIAYSRIGSEQRWTAKETFVDLEATAIADIARASYPVSQDHPRRQRIGLFHSMKLLGLA